MKLIKSDLVLREDPKAVRAYPARVAVRAHQPPDKHPQPHGNHEDRDTDLHQRRNLHDASAHARVLHELEERDFLLNPDHHGGHADDKRRPAEESVHRREGLSRMERPLRRHVRQHPQGSLPHHHEQRQHAQSAVRAVKIRHGGRLFQRMGQDGRCNAQDAQQKCRTL